MRCCAMINLYTAVTMRDQYRDRTKRKPVKLSQIFEQTNLQKVSNSTENTGKSSTGASNSIAGSVGGGQDWAGGSDRGSRWHAGWVHNRGGGVVVGVGSSWCGIHWLGHNWRRCRIYFGCWGRVYGGDGAGAVRDGQGGGLADGVGLAGMRKLSGQWAVSRQSSDDLSNPDWCSEVQGGHWCWGTIRRLWEVAGAGASNEESGSDGELHFG